MADPFEVRVRFTQHLQHLNATVNSAQKAATYALKHKEMDEDLHSCIIEQLEKNNMNVRANIFFFIEQLCEVAQKENHLSYVTFIHRDIFRIVDAVAPSDGTGAANIKVVRKGLPKLEQLSVLSSEVVAELNAALKERDNSTAHSPSATASSSQAPYDPTAVASSSKSAGPVKLDKRQVEQRIEEDRERHKRLKESVWEVSGEEHEEADRMWDEASDFGEDDLMTAIEEIADKEGKSVEQVQRELEAK